jgi:hypothetical protein
LENYFLADLEKIIHKVSLRMSKVWNEKVSNCSKISQLNRCLY